MSEWSKDVLEPIEALLKTWAARNEGVADGIVRPVWRANSGLTDGWADVLAALRRVQESESLPADESRVIETVADRIDRAVHRR